MKILSLILSCFTFAVHATQVLYIGDSHSFISTISPAADQRRFGNVLIDGLESFGHRVSYYAACGSEPSDWINGSSTNCGYTARVGSQFQSARSASFPGLGALIRPEHKLLIINLGDNMFDWSPVGTKRVARVNAARVATVMRSFMAQLPQANLESCVWIGPTYHIEGSLYRKTDLAVDALYVALALGLRNKCRLLDSRPLVTPVVPHDGLHHVNADSATWAQGILELL